MQLVLFGAPRLLVASRTEPELPRQGACDMIELDEVSDRSRCDGQDGDAAVEQVVAPCASSAILLTVPWCSRPSYSSAMFAFGQIKSQ